MNETQYLQQQIDELKEQIERLLSPVDFPLEFKNALVRQGFLKFRENVYRDGGVSGNTFKYLLVDYGNETATIDAGFTQVSFTANAGTDVCTANSHPFSDDQQVSLYSTGTLPAGLSSVDSYFIINATLNTFQLSLDGVNPVNITTTGTGVHYAQYLT